MSNEASTIGGRRLAAAGAALVVAAGLAAGCSSSSTSSSSSALSCPSKRGAAVTGNAPAGTGQPAAGWTQPDADLASTRDVASAITSSNVSKLGVAWTMPLTMSTAHTDGAYATTPVIVNGVVYVQDLDSDVFAISLATGKVLWTHNYNSPNGGPDGVNVADGVVYAATAKAAVALDAATGAQLWSRTLARRHPLQADRYAGRRNLAQTRCEQRTATNQRGRKRQTHSKRSSTRTPKIGYRLVDSQIVKIDALTGNFCYLYFGESLRLSTSNTSVKFSGSQNWADPMVGQRILLNLSPKISVSIGGDVGGWNTSNT